MPSQTEISRRIEALSGHSLGEEPQGNQMWLGEEYGVKFRLIKPESPVFCLKEEASHLVLVAEGENEGKERIKKDFIEAFGEPESVLPTIVPSKETVLLWDTAKALSHKPQQSIDILMSSALS